MIDSIGVALPARVMTTRDVIAGCVRPPRLPLEQTTGIASRRVAGDGEYAIDFAVRAARDCFRRSAIPPEDIDLLIGTSISRIDGDHQATYEPAAATRLGRLLGCRRAWTFDVTNACAGKFTGIYIADALIRSGQIRTALVVSGEFISHLLRTAQLEIDGDLDPRIACLTLGDAGSAVLLTRGQDERTGFEHIGIRTIGRYHSLCVAGPTEAPHGGAIMRTDMTALTAVTVREMVTDAQRTLARLGRSVTDIDRFIPHQTSLLAMHAAIRRANRIFGAPVLHDGNVINNLAERGNTATTAHIVAMYDGSRAGQIQSGHRLLFQIAGSGVNVGTAVYTLDDLPERLRTGTPSTRSAPPSTSLRKPVRPVKVTGIGLAGPAAPGTATTLELLREATAKCLGAAGRRPADVELLIHAGLYPSGLLAEPAIAAIAAGELGFDGATTPSRDVLGFDLTNGGLGLLDACRVACALIGAGEVGNAVVAASEVEQRDPGAAGPGLAACGSAQFLEAGSLGGEGYLGFHARRTGGDGNGFGAWAVQRGGRSFVRSGDRAALEDRYVADIPSVVAELLDLFQVRSESVRMVIPPSLSPPSTRRLTRDWPTLGERILPPDRPGTDLFTSAVPFGLERVVRTGSVAQGDLAVLLGTASGVEIGAALYRF